MTSAESPLLTLTGITRRFGSIVALNDARLNVRPGTVHALLGENGAGKTTLMRIAFGLLSPDEGTVCFRGKAQRIASPAMALSLGIGMVHQHFTLVSAMTVAENVALGGHGVFSPALAAERVHEVARRAGLSLDPHARVDSLSVGAQQRVEIVKALARDVQLLILDEPTAVLAPQESAELLQWMRAFADAGHAVVLITHKLRDALAIADDVTVLRRGRTVYSAPAAETSQDVLREAMVGTRSDAPSEDQSPTLVRSETTGAAPIEAVLQLEHASYANARGSGKLRDVSLSVRAGEIVGIAAVEGAGHHELLRVLAGRLVPQSGAVRIPPHIGFVPEDRHRDALMLDASLDENFALHGASDRRGRMPWRELREGVARMLSVRDVRAAGVNVRSRTLSGGNQQKFVLGRELADAPQAIVAENPSRGLDFQATAAVQQALRDARDAGAAVVVYSSDLDEVLLLANRVYAMFDGQLVETDHDRDALGRAMLGASK